MSFKSIFRPLFFIIALLALASALEAAAQTPVVKMTGVRFAYPLVEHWIEEYRKVKPDVQIIIEWRGSQDPSQYDILVEAYEQTEDVKKSREYIYVGRYAILPVATSTSEFARTYAVKGLTTSAIKQIYFHDPYADRSREEKISSPFTVYTRLQKAGSPIVFANYFKYEQKDIAGKGIAGSDDHLLKAVLRDTAGVSYLPSPVIYSRETGAPVPGITVLPVDINGNDRLTDDEKFYNTRNAAIENLASKSPKDIRNVPIEYLHLSIDQTSTNREAIAFMQWVLENGTGSLKDFGFLPPEPSKIQKEKFNEFAVRGPVVKP